MSSFNESADSVRSLPDDAGALEAFIVRRERQLPLKPGTAAGITWRSRGAKKRTPVSIVYLHGFSASHGDADPVHKTVAGDLGCNLYRARLYGHGLQISRPLGDLTPKKLWRSAQEAFAIGRKIGERVVVMASSAGGLLALSLAADPRFAAHIKALVLYSPLVHLYGINSLLLEHTTTRGLLQWMPGRRYLISGGVAASMREKNIWYQSYQLQGALALGQIIQDWVKPSLFKKIHCPVFAGYYFRNKHAHDRVVSAGATQRMMRMLGTPPADIHLQNFPEAGTHVIGSPLYSIAVEKLIAETKYFLKNRSGLNENL